MSLRFKGAELHPILAEAIANQCQVILVKDQGVYFLSEHGERFPEGRQKRIAYAVGCNSDIDPEVPHELHAEACVCANTAGGNARSLSSHSSIRPIGHDRI